MHHWFRLLAIAALVELVGFLPAQAGPKVEYEKETLDNGLRVIYAPLRQTPVIQVRVVYFVGSRDERPDRQGFAHMFEHMMFRGSLHVKPEEHMRLVNDAGGICNAFTHWDQTVYHDTLPANHLEMALYLEADRMASFKVTEDIYRIERGVVAKEWGISNNQPYFAAIQDGLRSLYTKHSYRWMPIGDMDHLKAAPVSDLQEFFNRYYIPNNACLIVAGDFDTAAAKAMVRKYFAWIPAGPAIVRNIPQEPEQTEARRVELKHEVPLPVVGIGYHLPAWKSDDHQALSMVAAILGGGDSSRLSEQLVTGKDPLCVMAVATTMKLYDPGLFVVGGAVLPTKDPAAVEKALTQAVADMVAKGPTQAELDKVRTSARIELLNSRKTAEQVATQLGSEEVFGDDAERVNKELAEIEALKIEDLQRVAAKYLKPERSTTIRVTPDLLGKLLGKSTPPKTTDIEKAPVVHSPNPVAPRPVTFPAGYPEHPPMSASAATPKFAKGTEATVNGVRVIAMTDSRLPFVNWSLIMRRGAYSEPAGKTGLGRITAEMVRRGAAGLGFMQLNKDLESRGISLVASSSGDHTTLEGFCTVEQLDHALTRARETLLQPDFPADELDKLKASELASLDNELADPAGVAGRELTTLLFGNSPLGRLRTKASVGGIALGDVKAYYKETYRPNDALLLFSGDITLDRAKELAGKLLAGWEPGSLPAVDYKLPSLPDKRHIVIIDNPKGAQSIVRMGILAYNNRDPLIFAGSAASTILSSGIESRMGKAIRSTKGYAYYARGIFSPDRQSGTFNCATETAFDTTGPTISAMFDVIREMKTTDVTADELAAAKSRAAGQMLMGMQTIEQQSGYRTSSILNGYSDDYYDLYPTKIGQVTPAQIREVLTRYADDAKFAIVVAAPAEKVKAQLETLGEVKVVPMPAKR
ncbi:MAG: pitrilysin family protein [Tepidisphaeraceae bacterium]|jgi:zinc protease